MGLESGKDGKVLSGATTIAHVTQWTFNTTALLSEFGSSSTAGFTAVVSGRKGGEGTIDYKWDNAEASPVIEGASVTLKLHTNATKFFLVPAVVGSRRLTVDIDAMKENTGSATFKANGAWTEPVLP